METLSGVYCCLAAAEKGLCMCWCRSKKGGKEEGAEEEEEDDE